MLEIYVTRVLDQVTVTVRDLIPSTEGPLRAERVSLAYVSEPESDRLDDPEDLAALILRALQEGAQRASERGGWSAII